MIVDALLGTGLRGPVEGLLGTVIEDLNAARAKRRGKTVVVAVDMPSGLASDSQDFGGPVVAADFTVTLTAPKVGQLVLPHSSCCGDAGRERYRNAARTARVRPAFENSLDRAGGIPRLAARARPGRE